MGAAPAVAAPTWLAEQKAIVDSEASDASAVMAPDGTVALSRVKTNPKTIQVQTRNPGGVLSAVQDLDSGAVSNLSLVAGPDGTFAAKWARDGKRWASIRRPGGTFSTPPREISPEASNLGADQIGLDGQGRLWLVYQSDASGSPLIAATLPADGSAASFPFYTESGGDDVTAFSMGVAEGGTVRIVYALRRDTNGGGACATVTSVRGSDATSAGVTDAGVLASRTATGTFNNPTCTLTGGSSLSDPHVAVSAGGDATAAFSESPEGPGTGALRARNRPAGSTWPATDSAPETVLGQDGDSLVAYAGSTPIAAIISSDAVSLSERGAGGSWSSPTAASGTDGAFPGAVTLAGGPGGAAVLVIWESSGEKRFQAVVRSPAGTLSPLSPVSTGNDFQASPGSAGVDDQGNAVFGFTKHTGADISTGYRAEFAGYDGAGPRLPSLSVPATGTVGQSLSFSVGTPVDVWSSVVGEPSWTFGDGVAADGASVSHAYAAPGTFSAAVSATDSLGNASSASGSVTVTAAAGPPPPGGGDKTKPVFRGKVKVKPSKVKRGKKATISFDLSEAAKLKATLTRKARGVKKGKRCVKPPRKRKRGQKRCTRNAGAGSFNGKASKAGPGKLTLPAKLRGRKLAAGRYTLRLVATDAAGNRSKPALAPFSVKP
jgi:hypothetical protein